MSRATASRQRRATQRPVAAAHVGPAPNRRPELPTESSEADGHLPRWLAEAQHESLTLSYWFEPAAEQAGAPIVLRFSGHRLGTGAHSTARDRFVHDETVTGFAVGAGPVCVTARVTDVNAGEWQASAAVVEPSGAAAAHGRRPDQSSALPVRRAAWSWRTRSMSEAPDVAVHTCPAAFARIPGVVRGVWAVMLVVGIGVALTSLALVAGAVRGAGPVLVLTIAGLVAGAVGAKLWFVVLHRRDGRREGWCVQGLVAGVVATVATAAVVAAVPAGTYLDVAAPGLLFGVAVGRIGCFFAGCCSGRATTAWWGVWSSDRRVGMRRVPTQLMESALALLLGVAALAIVVGVGPAHGGVFAASLAAYTLLRQAILHLRAEPRLSTIGSPATAAAAAMVIAGDVVAHGVGLLRLPAGV